jgi:hypothetical protein
MPSSAALTPEARSLRARIGAHALHARYDSRETTAKGRAKWNERFLDEVDPDRILPEPERLRRAEHARSAYMAKLALRSARARAARKRSTL